MIEPEAESYKESDFDIQFPDSLPYLSPQDPSIYHNPEQTNPYSVRDCQTLDYEELNDATSSSSQLCSTPTSPTKTAQTTHDQDPGEAQHYTKGRGPLMPKVIPEDNLFEVDCPWSLVEEIVQIYFSKVHCFVPILHEPQFRENYVSIPARDSLGGYQLSMEASLLLHCVLALAARFSTSGLLKDLPPADRGERFATKAKALYRLSQPRAPSLQYLQGCILLTFYLYLSEPDYQAWVMVGVSTRLAYELGIDKVDLRSDDSSNNLTPIEWRRQEELRRAWWSVWELDTFASAISCRPHTIDRTRIAVKLPVSDKNWFSDTPIDSAVIDPDPVHSWHSLRDSSNQDERAWFLLSNYLLLVAHELGQQQKPHAADIEKVEKAVACFVLLLPPRFHLDSVSESISFDPENFSQCNWVVCTNIMIQGCRAFINFLSENVTDSQVTKPINNLVGSLAVRPSLFSAQPKNYRIYADQLFRTIQVWPPAYIPYASPIIGGLIIGPAAIYLRVALQREGAEAEMLKLCLSHIARFWKIGSVFLEIANSVKL